MPEKKTEIKRPRNPLCCHMKKNRSRSDKGIREDRQQDGTNVALSVAVKTQDGKIFIEGIDCQPVRNGTVWLIDYLKRMQPKVIVIDGANGQHILAEELKDCKIKGAVLPTVKEIIAANALFEQGIFSESVCHAGQASMTQAASNCEKRPRDRMILAMGRRQLLEDAKGYIDAGGIPEDEFDVFDAEYKAYIAMGGNSKVKKLCEEALKLPLISED